MKQLEDKNNKGTRELLESRDFYYNILQNLGMGLLVVNKALQIEFANRVFLDCFEKNREDIIGKYCYEVLQPEDKSNECCVAKRALEKHEIVRDEFTSKNRIFEVTAIPLVREDQCVSILVFRNVSERRNLESQLIQSQKMAGLGQLAAGVAHELRNPLGIINTSLYYINDVLKPRQSDIQKHVKIIEEEIARSRKIIENLLEFSRRSDYEAEEVNVNNLLQTIFALLEKDFLVNDINLELHFGQLPCLYLNLDALKQAFLNIILNATQAMPNGGRLTVITRCVPAPSKSDPDGKGPIEQDFVKISFQDTGLGIPKESINNIFDPFFTTKEPGKGTGLGLTITYSVIKRCGGDIEVESGEGKGTKVTVILPIRKD